MSKNRKPRFGEKTKRLVEEYLDFNEEPPRFTVGTWLMKNHFSIQDKAAYERRMLEYLHYLEHLGKVKEVRSVKGGFAYTRVK